jgi:hypothetical protein
MPLVDMAGKVGKAIGCSFHEEEFNVTSGFAAHLLGLTVQLYDWRGLGDRVVFVLASVLEEGRFVDTPDGSEVDLEIDEISPAIADLLTVCEVGDWHPATEAEAEAERAHSGRISERIRQEEAEAASWPGRWRKS